MTAFRPSVTRDQYAPPFGPNTRWSHAPTFPMAQISRRGPYEQIHVPCWLPDHQKSCVQASKIITALTALVCLYTRSAGVGFFAAGAVACVLSAKVVKGTIRQKRPVHGRKTTYGYVLPGFPSCLACLFSDYPVCLVPTPRHALSLLFPYSLGVCTSHYIPASIRLLCLRHLWSYHGQA